MVQKTLYIVKRYMSDLIPQRVREVGLVFTSH